jgi:DNA-binding transcriptional MerR regulator
MRQLDLFGSFFETPQENKPGEKPAVLKKEEGQLTDEPIRPPHHKNFLRSESLAAAQIDPYSKNGESVQEKESSKQPIPSTSSSTSLLSLFDGPSSTENNFSSDEVDVSSETSEEAQFVEKQIKYLSAESTFSAIISEGHEVSVVQSLPDQGALQAVIAAPLQVEEKKILTSRRKKQTLPELQRNGAVIFDDGKISVKIKNKNPFPPPIVKEKKAKVVKPIQKRGRKSFKEIDAEVDLIEIPEDEILFQKQYYAISEVAKWFKVNTSLLRFWENEFDVLKPRKNRKGDRLFRPEDVKNLQLIYQLLRQRKYTIDGAKEYIKTNKKKADIQLQLTNTLQKFKSFLLDLKANLQP